MSRLAITFGAALLSLALFLLGGNQSNQALSQEAAQRIALKELPLVEFKAVGQGKASEQVIVLAASLWLSIQGR